MLTNRSSRQAVLKRPGENDHETSQEKATGRQRQKNPRNPCHIFSQNNIITIESHEGARGNKAQIILNVQKAIKGRIDKLHNNNKSIK